VAAVKWIKIVTDIFDDEKMLLVESLPSADSIIVIWFKLLCLAGKTNNSGVFIFNERIPYTDEMLASIFRRDVNIVRMALKTFENFGMIEIIDKVITIPNWSKHQTLDAYEKRKERDRERIARKRAEQRALIAMSPDKSSDASPDVAPLEEDIDREVDIEEDNNTLLPGAETPPDPPEPPKQKKPSSPVVITILLNDKTEYEITEDDVTAWKDLYQAVDIMQELRKMKGWADANPSKRKTRGGIKRFINGWLAKEQDKYHGPQGGGQNGAASQHSGNRYGTCI
jgi:predicted phage replisome organizer